jgi:N6-adenosine-specific RNA methylase IME4
MIININETKKKYSVIYADPPWQFSNKNTGGSMTSGSANQYDVMNVEDIKNLPISQLIEDDAILFMWWVGAMPMEALELVEAWGFKIKTMTGFTWIKETVNGKDFFGMGFYTRQQAENCLIAIKGKQFVQNHSVRQLIRAVNEQHSKKPHETYERINSLVGECEKLELFARNTYEGWDCWGNQI